PSRGEALREPVTLRSLRRTQMFTRSNYRTGWLVASMALFSLDARSEEVLCWKTNYGRGVGTIGTQCAAGQVKEVGLCYTPCAAGYSPVGPLCWRNCAS